MTPTSRSGSRATASRSRVPCAADPPSVDHDPDRHPGDLVRGRGDAEVGHAVTGCELTLEAVAGAELGLALDSLDAVLDGALRRAHSDSAAGALPVVPGGNRDHAR